MTESFTKIFEIKSDKESEIIRNTSLYCKLWRAKPKGKIHRRKP